MPRNLLTAIMMSALLALFLSMIPAVQFDDARTVPTFRPEQPQVLTQQNVVDLFTFVQTHYNIKRVKWENQSIYVDLAAEDLKAADLPYVYRDFYLLASQTLGLTQNVQHFFFRLMEEPADQPPKLLVAISADRPFKPAEALDPNDAVAIKRYVESNFHVRIDPFFHENISP